MRCAPVIALLLALAPALALAASAPAKAPVLRGPAKSQAPASAISPITPLPRSPLESLQARQGAGVRGGGAQCRTGCANDLYICRVDQDEGDCNRVWSQCVAACPQSSSGSY